MVAILNQQDTVRLVCKSLWRGLVEGEAVDETSKFSWQQRRVLVRQGRFRLEALKRPSRDHAKRFDLNGGHVV